MPSEAATVAPAPPALDPPAPKGLALVVDDSESILKDARALIEPLGFGVLTARGGEEGIALCLKHKPAFVLLDWSMAGLGGLDFVKALRALPGGERTKIIVCSGNSRPCDIHLAMRAGASEYLLKPFDEDILAFKLRQAGLL
jgi:two-component system chemotaxis response regulator CheY